MTYLPMITWMNLRSVMLTKEPGIELAAFINFRNR